MAADSRKSTSDMFISRRTKKNHRNHRVIIAAANTTPGPDTTPTHVVIKPKTLLVMTPPKVPVLYYLTRNGHIEHPHLIDVPLSSPHGLYLRDVMNTLNNHRGKGMANMYSWSFKRSYKNGYVWHDLSEDDLVEATNSHDYILKGSELLERNPTEITQINNEDCVSTTAAAAIIRRRNQSWSSFDNPQEYMVVKCESSRELAANFAADAATQTDDQMKRLSFSREKKDRARMMVRREEMISVISPPPSNSSSEVSEGVIGARYVDRTVTGRGKDPSVEDQLDASGKMKASQVLKQLIACGVPSRLKM